MTAGRGVNHNPAVFCEDDYADYVDELRHYWQENPVKTNYSAKQWLEMDPEVEKIFDQILLEKEMDRQRLMLRIKTKLMAQAKMPTQIWKDILVETVRISDGEKLEKINREILWFRLGKVKLEKGEINDNQIQQARDFPVEDLMETKKIRKMWCCPFHEEKTPSFHIYKENSWHCFGCQAHGNNAIDFVMQKEKMGFVAAVKFLTGK